MPHFRRDRTSGFSLIEAILAMALTVVVLGAVFALLAQGITTPRVETERADVQARARAALEQVTRDVMAAGANLPPEFPAFTPFSVNRSLAIATGHEIELVRSPDRGDVGEAGPIEVLKFDGRTASLAAAPSQIDVGNVVLIYDDAPTLGKWTLGIVTAIRSEKEGADNHAEIDVETSSQPKGAPTQGGGLPFDIARYNRETPASGWVTPVEVVRYFTRADASGTPPAPSFGNKKGPGPTGPPPALTLMRQVDWGEPVSVASVETFQVRYVVGGTVPATLGPRYGVPSITTSTSSIYYVYKEETLDTPPLPQPDPALPIKPQQVVAGVLVTVTTSSESANLVGSTRTERDPEGHLRKTLSSRATPRNVLYRLSQREQAPTFN